MLDLSEPRVSLDGGWDFQIDCDDDTESTAPKAQWRSVIVPMPWQAQFDDLRETSGVAWYRRYFSVDADSLRSITERVAILHFGAVDYDATVWVNGSCIGEHEGGYLPFEFDVIDLLHKGENELLVKVIDSTDDRHRYPSFPFSEVPHGKQSWYGPIGGIWQSVWLEFRPKLHLTGLRLEPSPLDATINVQVRLNGTLPDTGQVICTVTNLAGKNVGAGTLDQDLRGVIRLEDPPELWGPDSPNLYAVTATLQVNGTSIHAVSKACGFRTIEARQGRIYLNGEPIYLRGALDQGYYPETIYTPLSLEFLEAQALSAKALGLNCLRIHIKVEDPRYYDVADRLGLLIWTEIPNWALLTEASAERGKRTFQSMLERDGHHPSIIAWTLINENWGTDLSRNADHRRWLANFYRDAKSLDPTRLVIDNSACIGNAHVAGDLEDFHYYRAIPDHARHWDEWVAEFAKRSDWAWYSDFAHERRSDLPLVVSEFGNWGLPDPESIQEHHAEPWWFETGFEWDGGIVYPHGVLHRFESCGLADLFSSYAEFTQHAQEHMARSLHYEISGMRLHDAIAGYIVTEFTDVHWECNGLLTMQRQPKYLLDPLLKDLNQDNVIVLRPTRWSGRPSEAVDVTVQTIDVRGRRKDGKILWQAGARTGELPAADETISVVLDGPGILTLYARWLQDDGKQFATNQVNLVCTSAEPTQVKLHVVDDGTLGNALGDLGYEVSDGDVSSAAADEIVVTSSYTKAVEAHIQSGGRVLVLADPTNPGGSHENVPLPVGYIALREGSVWQGDWANSIAWVRKQGPLASLPGGPLLEMEWAKLMPDAVVAGLPLWVQSDHSWAGLAVGWLHKAVSLLTVMPYGRGQILITTFKINATTLAGDAIAQALFAGMLQLLRE
jgi:Glycosyl hydrolases family 2, sugar binding domain/Glycosyl hydrolases family 2/Glycosyl hydrolases family 2, TIM barrel domain